MVLTHFHFVHYCRNDDKAPSTVTEWVLPPRDGNAMLRCFGISINYVVFRAYKYARGTIRSLGGGELATWNLYEEVRPGIRGLAPFSYDVIEAQIELVVG
jgi:hypothetical protein